MCIPLLTRKRRHGVHPKCSYTSTKCKGPHTKENQFYVTARLAINIYQEVLWKMNSGKRHRRYESSWNSILSYSDSQPLSSHDTPSFHSPISSLVFQTKSSENFHKYNSMQFIFGSCKVKGLSQFSLLDFATLAEIDDELKPKHSSLTLFCNVLRRRLSITFYSVQ